MARTIALIGAFDTKGSEYRFVRDCIQARGHRALMIDVGVLGKSIDSGQTGADAHSADTITADVTSAQIAAVAGSDLPTLQSRKDRGEAVAVMSRGAEILLPRLYAQGRFDGVLALGGSGGTSVACAAMRALPMGVPKVMVSTVAGGDVSGYVGVQDIVMIPSILDVSGINKISRQVFARAAGAICGMVETQVPTAEEKPLIAASMFGNTTPAVETAKPILERAGFEVLVFHCTGTGGRTMESLVDAGLISGVLDMTTTELADELVGGVLSAGPTRLDAAARSGKPAVVTPGCLDMVNFWAPDTVPARFADRKFYPHNPNVTLMRTDVNENRRLGETLARKLNASCGPVDVFFPLKGLSMIDAPGGPFWWPEADQALLASLKAHLRPDIPLTALDCNINDPAFAEACAARLLSMIGSPGRS